MFPPPLSKSAKVIVPLNSAYVGVPIPHLKSIPLS